MTYQPTLQDAASDLWRCVYASFNEPAFESPSFKMFLTNSLTIVSANQAMLEPLHFQLIGECLDRAQNLDLEPNKRREDILTAAILLKNA